MFFVQVENGLVISKTDYNVNKVPEGHIEISKELYESIGAIPCSFTEVDGEIVNFEYIEPIRLIPEPTPLEILQEKYDMLQGAVDFIVMSL